MSSYTKNKNANKGLEISVFMSPASITIIIVAYISLLFWLARRGDKRRLVADSWVRHPLIYALALGVYCTSWTFYGLVGSASVSTSQFIPILLGPILLFIFGFSLLRRIHEICTQEHIHNIADFIASRYGRRQGIAASVTVVVLLATVPYISLQLKAVSDSLSLVIGTNALGNQDITFFIAAAMILFALLFGTSQLDTSGYHGGLMSAIAFESIVKLLAMGLIAVFAFTYVLDNPTLGQLMALENEPQKPVQLTLRFFVETGLSACAIFCLPRMFQVAFVECLSPKHLNTARFSFPIYLALIGVFIYLIAKAGNSMFYNGGISADTYVIAIPLALDSSFLTAIAFLGGFSAATAMIIVATITLSQMLSNDVILPIMMRRQQSKRSFQDYSRLLIMARRITVIAVVFAAYLYQIVLTGNSALTSIGLIAFALSVHLAPAILLGLYWKNCNAIGVYAGLSLGVATWAYMLILPILAQIGMIDLAFITAGPFGIAWLSPDTLLGFDFSDAFTRCVIISLSINIAGTVFVSRLQRTTLADRIQASTFCQIELQQPASDELENIKLSDLKELVSQFAGQTVTQRMFSEHDNPNGNSSAAQIETARRALSGIAGVASANSMIDSLRSGQKFAVEDVVSMFGETRRALQFNQDILFSSFENISSGISVVNQDLNMVAWNRRYEEMFNYPKGMLKIGTPVADLVKFNASRGLLGSGDIETLVQKRLEHLRKGRAYRVVRDQNDGHVIEIKGTPLPDGGYVTTYDDISDFMRIQQELEMSNQTLENRVASRTEEIHRINEDLRKEIDLRKEMEGALLSAKAEAEAANATKSRFLALASHDILQPINAAQLYVESMLEAQNERRDTRVLQQIHNSIGSAESIISSLLDISRIDTDSLKPDIRPVSIEKLLKPLIDDARVQLSDEVELRHVATSAYTMSDPKLLSRILQNFISNAVKYTDQGKILIGCRRHEDSITIHVYDSGAGIPEDDLDKIFVDFYRSPQQTQVSGLGLGLAVAQRLAQLLEHPLQVHSQLKQGSCFSITVPLQSQPSAQATQTKHVQDTEIVGINIVYVDDVEENLDATEALLRRWQCKMVGLQSVSAAQEYSEHYPAPDAILMDFQLGDPSIHGIMLAEQLLKNWGKAIPVCVISAAPEPELASIAKEKGFEFLSKPVKPAKLRAWLNHIQSS